MVDESVTDDKVESRSAPDLSMYQDLSIMQDADLQGYTLGDEVIWVERDDCHLMPGMVVGESNFKSVWGTCVQVRFGCNDYHVLPSSIAPREVKSATESQTDDPDVPINDISRDDFKDTLVVMEIGFGYRGRCDSWQQGCQQISTRQLHHQLAPLCESGLLVISGVIVWFI